MLHQAYTITASFLLSSDNGRELKARARTGEGKGNAATG